MKKLLPLLLSCLVLLAGSAWAETVLIAGEDDWAPYSSIKKDRSGPEGFAVDVVREAFKTQGVTAQFTVLPFTRCLRDAEIGKVVGCFDATIIKSNEHTYHWHPTPLMFVELTIFGRKDDPKSNVTLSDLEGKVVGTTIGYTYPTSFTENKKIKHFEANSDAQLVKMLANKRVDYVLLNGIPGYLLVRNDAQARDKLIRKGMVSVDGFWVAFSKNHKDGKRMSEVFEKGMQELHKNGKYKAMEAELAGRLKLPNEMILRPDPPAQGRAK